MDSDYVKHAGDAVSAAVVVGTLAQWLPSIAAAMTIIWTAIRIFETRTVQRALGRDVPPSSAKGDGE